MRTRLILWRMHAPIRALWRSWIFGPSGCEPNGHEPARIFQACRTLQAREHVRTRRNSADLLADRQSAGLSRKYCPWPFFVRASRSSHSFEYRPQNARMRVFNSMSVSVPIHAPRVSAQSVFSKTDYFVDVELWPLLKEIDGRRWLTNFTDSERSQDSSSAKWVYVPLTEATGPAVYVGTSVPKCILLFCRYFVLGLRVAVETIRRYGDCHVCHRGIVTNPSRQRIRVRAEGSSTSWH